MSVKVTIPVEVIAYDEMTAQAIAESHGSGRSYIVCGRFIVTPAGRQGSAAATTMRVEAEQILFIDNVIADASEAPTTPEAAPAIPHRHAA